MSHTIKKSDRCSKLSPSDRLNQISQHGMCIGCGLCESVLGKTTVAMEIVSNGAERPIINPDNPPTHAMVDKVYATCPGTRLENIPSGLLGNTTQHDPIWGDYQSLIFAHSSEPEVRHLASTGGFLTAMALYLLESKSVHFIAHARASNTTPSFGEATISRSREDILAAAGSRYGPTATLKNIVQVLDNAERHSEVFAFIGTPCDVSALRNLAHLDARVDQYCHLMLTMVCGGFMAPKALNQFISDLGVDNTKVKSIRYRGFGCPGPTTITLDDDSVVERSYLDFWGEDESAWQLPSRCKVCADGIGDAADIAAADCWDGGSPTVASSASDLGTNATIIRSDRGLQMVNDAVTAGYLELGENITTDDLNRFQPHQVAKKKAVYARFKGMQDAGYMTPETKGLRIRCLASKNTAEFNHAERNGTKLRVESGRFGEPIYHKAD